MSVSSTNEAICPKCRASLEPCPGYVVWCPSCDWNIAGGEQKEPKNLFERFYARSGRRLSRQLFESVCRKGVEARHLSLSRVAGVMLAVSVHLITLAFLIGGIVMMWRWYPKFAPILAGLFCVSAAFAMRPRFAKRPKDSVRGDQMRA